MGLAVQTNMPALNTNNKLSESKKKFQKSMEKLASGCRINRSADDASGLAISEKMRNQISVLDTDVDTCEDGINMIQTAEGAMAEVADILTRCATLAGKAANGILGDEEREMIQDEIDELHDEIDRIHLTAKFNDIKLFDHKEIDSTPTFKGKLPKWMKMDWASEKTQTLASSFNGPLINVSSGATTFDISSFKPEDVPASVGKGFSVTCCQCEAFYSLEFTNKDENSFESFSSISPITNKSQQNYVIQVGLKGAKNSEDVYNRIQDAVKNVPSHSITYDYKDGILAVGDYRGGQPTPTKGWGLSKAGVYRLPNTGDLDFKIGESSISADHIYIDLPEISTEDLGISDTYVLTQDEALEAMDTYKAAGVFISQERGRLGAIQNRIEHTINNHTTTSENTTAAKSRIADTDMAKEYMEMTTHSVLNQSALSLLAQANGQPESVISLLQG